MTKKKPIKLRASVQWFAEQMERKLRIHDADRGRRGWRGMSFGELYDRMDDECIEMLNAVHPSDVISEATDVANFAMMIADNNRK